MCIYDCMWNITVRLLINRFLSLSYLKTIRFTPAVRLTQYFKPLAVAYCCFRTTMLQCFQTMQKVSHMQCLYTQYISFNILVICLSVGSFTASMHLYPFAPLAVPLSLTSHQCMQGEHNYSFASACPRLD